MSAKAFEMPAELVDNWRALGLWKDVSLGQAMARAASDKPAAMLHIHAASGMSQASLAEVHAAGLRLAGSLYALGVRPGDTVAMQLPNRLENAIVFQAAAALGCVLLPVVHIFGPAELTHILTDSKARVLIVPDRWRNIDYLDRLARIAAPATLQHRIILGDSAPEGTMRWDDLPQGEFPSAVVDPGAPALLLYTSGTTAAPKGVLHSSRSLFAELHAQNPHDREVGWFAPWPSGHIAGTLGILGHALLGREMVMMESWDPAVAAMLIERFRVGQVSGTPFHLGGLLDAAERDGRSLASLSQFIIGATSVPPSMVSTAEKVGVRCCRCYGSTELPTLSQCRPEDPLDKRLNTDGRLNPGCELRIVDDEGNDVPLGEAGELAVRGAERFLRYTDPALNDASFLAGGWFLTGDIGRMDAEGFLAITDRKKDIIIRGGENISSREVEDLLSEIPGVGEAAVIGWPDDRLGEKVCAVVLANGQPATTIETVDAHFKQRGVARQKTPEALLIVEEFPRTPSGKVQKAELRKNLQEAGLLPRRL